MMSDVLPDSVHKVWYLERRLFELLPEEDAEVWDNVGLLVGDPDDDVERIAVALDPSIRAVQLAASRGCNVLLTHHPVFLEPPRRLLRTMHRTWAPRRAWDDSIEGVEAGGVVMVAAREGVNLIAMHTNLDRSIYGRQLLPDALGLSCLDPGADATGFASGRLDGSVSDFLQVCSTSPTRLHDLASRCHEVFGRTPRVWGAPEQMVQVIGTCPGSGGSFLGEATRLGLDCLICGETRYHVTRAAHEMGLAVIELGHDVSERLYTDVLRILLRQIGVPADDIVLIDEEPGWWTP
ncbi:MAG: Nif3-like dinuclear metal center hexameric protein [Actinomycetota bacterium]|nr:Nif3-like dinuclear metal center hexameric protein [Actinomycetota bacterium]